MADAGGDAPETPGDRHSQVAEVPSGGGYHALPAARITDLAPVYALDLEESLLEALAHLAEQQGVENFVTLQGDARDLTRRLLEPVDVVEQARDALRPGDRFVAVNWHDAPREATTSAREPWDRPPTWGCLPETERLVTDAAGYSPAERVELPPYHYGFLIER